MAEKLVDFKGSLSQYAKSMNLSKSEHFSGTMELKLTGVSFDGRQENLKWVNFDTPLRLSRDRSNKFDKNAILVQALIEDEWKEIGFIPAAHNRSFARALDDGVNIDVKFGCKYSGDANYNIGMMVILTAL